jgi:ribosome biogenesis GTPase
MSKRYLTDQQKTRIAKQQSKHSDTDEQTETGLVVARYGKHIDIEDSSQKLHRCYLRQNLGQVAVGDNVLWKPAENDASVVVAIEPRSTSLFRYNKFEGDKLIAANVDQLIIVVAPEPVRSINILDRYLMLAELQHITPIIIFNKIDLLDEATLPVFNDILDYYKNLDYLIIHTSTTTHEGLSLLADRLVGKNSIVVGLSGVGKSALVKYFLPDHNIQIGDLSEKSGEGSHTTTRANLYHLPIGGNIIDCPGIRELSFDDLTPQQVVQGFKELRNLAADCQFRDCSHTHEPGCAVLKAIEAGNIDSNRLASFRSIIEQKD